MKNVRRYVLLLKYHVTAYRPGVCFSEIEEVLYLMQTHWKSLLQKFRQGHFHMLYIIVLDILYIIYKK